MGGGGKSGKPAAYSPPPVAESAETLQAEEAAEVKSASDKARKAAAAAQGRRSTILTGNLGDVTEGSVQRKTLLGQ